MADDLIAHKNGKTRRATSPEQHARLVKAGWTKGRPKAAPKPKGDGK